MQECLELKTLRAFVPDQQGRLQRLSSERDAVDQCKGVGPCLACLGAQIGGRETKVQGDAAVTERSRRLLGFGRGFVQKLPSGRPSEAMLSERGRRAVRWWRPKHLRRASARHPIKDEHQGINVPGILAEFLLEPASTHPGGPCHSRKGSVDHHTSRRSR